MDTLEIKGEYSKRSHVLKVQFRYGIRCYGYCHVSFNLELLDSRPTSRRMWGITQFEMHWENYKNTLYLQHRLLKELLEYDFHCVGTIKTINALNDICAGIHTVDYCISYAIQDELKRLLRNTEQSLIDYALEEFKALTMPV